jgi:hypothetical protein
LFDQLESWKTAIAIVLFRRFIKDLSLPKNNPGDHAILKKLGLLALIINQVDLPDPIGQYAINSDRIANIETSERNLRTSTPMGLYIVR